MNDELKNTRHRTAAMIMPRMMSWTMQTIVLMGMAVSSVASQPTPAKKMEHFAALIGGMLLTVACYAGWEYYKNPQFRQKCQSKLKRKKDNVCGP